MKYNRILIEGDLFTFATFVYFVVSIHGDEVYLLDCKDATINEVSYSLKTLQNFIKRGTFMKVNRL